MTGEGSFENRLKDPAFWAHFWHWMKQDWHFQNKSPIKYIKGE